MLIAWITKTLIGFFLWPVNWFKDGPVIDSNELILWAANDPFKDREVAKIDAARFFNYILKHPKELDNITGHKGVVRAIAFLKIHAGRSRTRNVVWTSVFAKVYARNFVGLSVKRLSGLPSLVYWLIRNTGVGTPVHGLCTERLMAFTLANKHTLWDFIRRKREKMLAKWMEKLSVHLECNYIRWPNVIAYLVKTRHLFS
ncbi:uncharacterized protein LOC141853106 [Brevipalpus obovatus]|uniref:uncharacterized protein LOC141853106 n=1 Tax=Brevipalpus obovatus TaxID=246614 RepID=UPI003D9F12C9